jgi:magnesium transporter
MTGNPQHLDDPVLAHARKDFAALRDDLTIEQALEAIRKHGIGEKIVYFYVVDAGGRLVGVVPTRRLLTADLGTRLADVMVTKVITIPRTATLLDACDFFILHKLLAFPVVDDDRRILGVVDVALFTEEIFGIAEWERMDEVFGAIGFRVSQVRTASPLKAFRFRFPWLVAPIAGGAVCALLANAYQATLAGSVALAFFMALVLALGESVSIQSMTVTLQALRSTRPTLHWYVGALARELSAALLLGGGCGLVAGLLVWLWKGVLVVAVVVGSAILLGLCAACFFGLTVPTVIHALKLDPKISAGPVTLAFTDIASVLFYLTLAALIL